MEEPFPFNLLPSNEDERFMDLALREAWKAFLNGEVPVGAIVVYQGEPIAAAHNNVEGKRSALAHAEMTALALASEKLKRWRLQECTLYSSLEPCSMCAGATLLARISRIVWGAPDFRHGANGSWIDILGKEHPIHTLEVKSGIYKEHSRTLLRSFFQQQRIKKKKEHGNFPIRDAHPS